MTDKLPEKPDFRKLAILVVALVISITVFIVSMFNILEEPEEPEGIFVKFILFFKQNMLI